MYKLKQKEGYRKVYDVKLCKGEIFKATGELKNINIRLEELTDEFIDASENGDELIEKRIKLGKKRENKIIFIKKLKEDLVEYEELLANHESGELDIEYTEKYDNKEEEKSIRREKRFEKRTKTNTENKKVSQQFYSNSRQASSRTRYMNKQYDYHYRYFVRNSAKVPDFIMRNLQNMPNNKGYIWRSIWFYGAKQIPKIRNSDGKFVDDNTLKMHEIVGKETYIRFKDVEGKWTITKKEKRTNNFKNNNNNFKNNNFRNNNFRKTNY